MRGKLLACVILGLLLFESIDKPLCCGSIGWSQTGWGGEVRYAASQALGMRVLIGGRITEYYIPSEGWVK